MKFAQLSSIFNGTNERYQNSANIRQYWTVFPSDFNIINLIHIGLLQNFMRYCERLQKFVIFHKANKIFLVKSFTFVHFHPFAMYFVDFCFCYKSFQNMTAEFWFRPDNFEILNFRTCLS